jgi:hypothetical protein
LLVLLDSEVRKRGRRDTMRTSASEHQCPHESEQISQLSL